MFSELFTNIFGNDEVASQTPDASGDYYFITDRQADHNYFIGKICDALQSIATQPAIAYQILYGGNVTDSGSGQVDISECVAIGVDNDGARRLMYLPELTNVTLPTGYDDGSQIWVVLRYDFKLGSSTRTHRVGTSYHYQIQDTYYGDPSGDEGTSTDDLFTKTDPNGVGVVLGSFKMNSTTFTSMDALERSPVLFSYGILPYANNNSIGSSFGWYRMRALLKESIAARSTFYNGIVSTYTTIEYNYLGGVLDAGGSIHCVPFGASVGQKISSSGVVSTYPLVYDTTGAYYGGVLQGDGDVHFVPYSATVGQKISSSGVVSTYSLVHSTTHAFIGGVLDPSGTIHFIPHHSQVGQKIGPTGVVSTYTLVVFNSVTGFGAGGVLAANGDIHFVPATASVGQKISSAGVVSTYTLVHTTNSAYFGGVIDYEGTIHFIPDNATVGQKISSAGVVSTYSLVYTTANAYHGGVLAPTGDIYFVPFSAPVGQKISSTGVVSTYSLVYTTAGAYGGGILMPNGEIHFIPNATATGQKISTLPAKPWGIGICCHPFFNKF
jgi:hypothetical protein